MVWCLVQHFLKLEMQLQKRLNSYLSRNTFLSIIN